MANKYNSLSHTKWLCKYHIVIVPKYRRKDRHKIVELTSKMLQIEPYFKRHIYTAVSVYYYFKMWTNVVSLFEHIKDVICEPYSEEWFMSIVVYSYRMVKKFDKANQYLIYICPDKREKIMED